MYASVHKESSIRSYCSTIVYDLKLKNKRFFSNNKSKSSLQNLDYQVIAFLLCFLHATSTTATAIVASTALISPISLPCCHPTIIISPPFIARLQTSIVHCQFSPLQTAIVCRVLQIALTSFFRCLLPLP